MKLKSLLIAACIGMMFAACSSRDEYSAANDDTIKLRATVVAPSIGTRVDAGNSGIINDELPVGDKILVHFYKSGLNQDLILGDEGSTDFKYTIGNLGVLTADGSEPSWENNTLDILAYYPHNFADVINSWEGWWVQENQSIIANYKSSDLMIAQLYSQTKANGPITLPFKHMLSKIVVILDEGSSGLDVANATGINVYAQTYYEFIYDANSNPVFKLSAGDGNSDIKNINLGDYQSGGLAGIIPPQTIPTGGINGKPFVSFTFNSVQYNFYPTTDLVLKGGYQYTFTLTIDNNTVKAKGLTVTPWETTADECNKLGSATY